MSHDVCRVDIAAHIEWLQLLKATFVIFKVHR